MRKILIICILFFLLPSSIFCQTSEKSLSELNWRFRQKGSKLFYPASIPGTIHTDLLKNKLIPDPFFGDNEKQLQWIENEDWEYITVFEISKEEFTQQHIELTFDGLDTYAKIYFNDSLILIADNMFRIWHVDIKKNIVVGNNKLKIVFESAVCKGKEEAKKLSYTLPGDEKVFTRKAQYQYGWDFGPRLVTCGIWKNVKLVFWNKVKIENVKYKLISLTDSFAELEFECEINSEVENNFELNAICHFPEPDNHLIVSVSKEVIHLQKGINYCKIKFSIKNPQRWWCNALGAPFLYPCTIKLLLDENEIDSKSLNIGVRTIELMQESDSIGKSFYFKLNGVPVFMKGANYIPPDNFIPRVAKNDYEKIIQNTVDANMNMIRVWGGGVYADDAFYDACDKNGILVWQDFMFACAMYPSDENFIHNVSEEIRDQIIRLRNHPSLALWCGNNEIDEGWKNWGWQKQYNYTKMDSIKIWDDYRNLFQKTIPEIVSKNDGHHFYWQSSPSIGWGHKESLLSGDSHYWGVWWGMEPFENYKTKVGRFMSEYGFEGLPNIETLKRLGINPKIIYDSIARNGEEEEYKLGVPVSIEHKTLSKDDSLILLTHQKHPTGFQTIKTYMERDYKVPKFFDNYSYVSQLLQADGFKTAIEADRRAKPNCMGSLFWQLNDCWPGISWSSIDYYGSPKAAFYQVKRSFENIILSINEENENYNIYIINDELKSSEAKLELKLIEFNGKVLWDKAIDVSVSSNSSAIYFSIPKIEFVSFPLNKVVLSASLKLDDMAEPKSAFYYFLKPKDLELNKPSITLMPISNNQFQITSDVLAKDVCLGFFGAKFNDNFFDLIPNQKKIIAIESGKSLLDMNERCFKNHAELKLSVESLYNTIEK